MVIPNFLIRICRLGYWKNIWLGVVTKKVPGWRGQYGEMLGINLARLTGRHWWLNGRRQIATIDFRERWEISVNYGLVGRVCWIREYAESRLMWLWKCLVQILESWYLSELTSQCEKRSAQVVRLVEWYEPRGPLAHFREFPRDPVPRWIRITVLKT